ncbi:DUF1302 domain-containing protein [Thalassomonas sp. RHCl1]|uniref:DUF1302 domain-containing protein n=1 Tax=Thalassomonas sp. RHCl1 TaxID=2995320 RepID=UPI00248B16EA|nr:DUF1302 domain-containing protein [Thalassomonas sp. RHCl1]
MKHHPRDKFYKKPLALSITAALMSFAASQASAANFQLGDFDISFDSTFTAGSSWRVEDRNWSDNVAKSNNLKNGFDFSSYNAAFNNEPGGLSQRDIWLGSGNYSNNGDNGNLNYDSGETFSKMIKGSHELDIRNGDFGLFVRGMYFYDFEMMDESRAWDNPINGNTNDPCRDKEAREQICRDVRLLDAFVYGDFEIGEMPLSVRLGQQVISWGESALISHGLSEINPVDFARLKAPGAELKEAFIPFGALWASLGVTENFNIELYYQYEWEKTVLPAPGSYFSTNDFAGDGGQYNNIQLGFGGRPDLDLDSLLEGLNEIGDMLRSGDPEQMAAAQAAYVQYPTKVTLRAPGSKAELKPKDGGQYGLRLSWYLPEFNDTELSLYYVNYHSRRPLFSGITADFSAETMGADLATIASGPVTIDNYSDLNTFSQVLLSYPEDINMYALSWNSTLGTTAFSGEITYRQDEPLQIDDVELLYAAMPQQLYNAGLRDDTNYVSQMVDSTGNPYGSGVQANGFILSDTIQAQMTFAHLFGPTLGASQFTTLLEVGAISIEDMPDKDELRLNGPGTGRSGVIAAAPGLNDALQGGVETNPFPDDFAWGYRVVTKLEYNDVFAGINVSPKMVFSHDVQGITPDPIFLFVEDRKSVSLGVTLDYQSRWSADFSYNSFFDGVGTTNQMEDRDFVSFSVKYSI